MPERLELHIVRLNSKIEAAVGRERRFPEHKA